MRPESGGDTSEGKPRSRDRDKGRWRAFSLELELAPEPGEVLIARFHGACDKTAVYVFERTLCTLSELGFTRLLLDMNDFRGIDLRVGCALHRVSRRLSLLDGSMAILCPPQLVSTRAFLKELLRTVPIPSNEDAALMLLRRRLRE